MVYKTLPFFTLIGLYFHATDYDYPPETVFSAVLTILPMIWLVVMVILTSPTIHEQWFNTQKKFIIIGLAISMLGDISMVWRVKLFIPGLLFFAIAQACYIKAYGFKPAGFASGLVCYVIAFLIDTYMLPGITEGPVLQCLVVVYTALIFTMAWRAMVQALHNPSVATWAGFLGAVSFVVSDVMIALTKWRPIDVINQHASFYIMVTYYAAQLGIAYSVFFAEARHTGQKKSSTANHYHGQ